MATPQPSKIEPRTAAERVVQFIEDAIADGATFGNLTEEGMNAARVQMRAALPYVPRIIMSGDALDDAGATVEQALAKIIAAAPVSDEISSENPAPDDREQAGRAEALYTLGLLVGAELAMLTMTQGDHSMLQRTSDQGNPRPADQGDSPQPLAAYESGARELPDSGTSSAAAGYVRLPSPAARTVSVDPLWRTNPGDGANGGRAARDRALGDLHLTAMGASDNVLLGRSRQEIIDVFDDLPPDLEAALRRELVRHPDILSSLLLEHVRGLRKLASDPSVPQVVRKDAQRQLNDLGSGDEPLQKQGEQDAEV